MHRARITAAFGRHLEATLEDGRTRLAYLKGRRTDAVVGDWADVSLQGDREARIEHLQPRRNLVYRADELRSKQFAANLDQVLLVVATTPSWAEETLARALIAVHAAQVPLLIVLNKVDLSDRLEESRSRLKAWQNAGVSVLESIAHDPQRCADLKEHYLQGRDTLLLGPSGMGKSSLLNQWIPNAAARTGETSMALDAGRHTTTGTRLYALPGPRGGALIDSPGFQTFGLAHVSAEDLFAPFTDLHEAAKQCRFYNCTHCHEPGCGVLLGVARGELSASRHAMYVRLRTELEQRRLNAY